MSLSEFSFQLGKLSPLILILGILLGIFSYKKLDAVHKSIIFYFLMMLLVDIYSRFLWRYGNNQVTLLVYSLIEVIGVGYFYHKIFLKRKYIITIAINILVVIYIIWELFSYLFLDSNVQHFQPYAKVADNFVIIVLSLTFLYEKMN